MTTQSTQTSETAARGRPLPTLCALLCALALGGCATAKGGETSDLTKPITGEAASDVAKAYQRGLDEKRLGNYIDALRYLEYVRQNFPYSQYSALSQLALADMSFERDEFLAAANSYIDFVKSHPSHPKADYAAFRVGLSYFQDRPSEFFMLPPAHEKDQASVHSALEALQKFVRNYPKSELVPQARKLISDCRDRIAAHERYVADFYWKQKRWNGAALRYQSLADTYGDLNDGQLKLEALWRASEAQHNAGALDAEKSLLERLISEFPSGERRLLAQARLKALDQPTVLRPVPAEAATPAPEGQKQPEPPKEPQAPADEQPKAP